MARIATYDRKKFVWHKKDKLLTADKYSLYPNYNVSKDPFPSTRTQFRVVDTTTGTVQHFRFLEETHRYEWHGHGRLEHKFRDFISDDGTRCGIIIKTEQFFDEYC